MFAGKRVLITGALGTLGQALVNRFSEEGAVVFAWDRPDSVNPQESLDKIAPGVTFVGGDLNDLELILKNGRSRWLNRSAVSTFWSTMLPT